jgi:hypothetical protein
MVATDARTKNETKATRVRRIHQSINPPLFGRGETLNDIRQSMVIPYVSRENDYWHLRVPRMSHTTQHHRTPWQNLTNHTRGMQGQAFGQHVIGCYATFGNEKAKGFG